MEFCDNCENYLSLKEIREEKEEGKEDTTDTNSFDIIYHCSSCDLDKPCNNYMIYRKVYKKEGISMTDAHLNTYKARDPTLPRRKSKCTKCNKIDNNPYQVKYADNSFNILSICLTCNHMFKYEKI